MRARAFAVFATIVVISSVASAEKKPAKTPAKTPPATANGSATAPAQVVVSVKSTKKIRVQLSEGSTLPCDSRDNKMLFDSTLGNGQGFQGTTDLGCICVRHTSDAFPQAGWSESKMVCRPKTCKGKVCKPLSSAPIRVDIDATK